MPFSCFRFQDIGALWLVLHPVGEAHQSRPSSLPMCLGSWGRAQHRPSSLPVCLCSRGRAQHRLSWSCVSKCLILICSQGLFLSFSTGWALGRGDVLFWFAFIYYQRQLEGTGPQLPQGFCGFNWTCLASWASALPTGPPDGLVFLKCCFPK